MENLIIAFCCFRPEQYTDKMNDFREIEYLWALKQLKRIKWDNFDLIIINNTKIQNKQLYSFLDNENYIQVELNTGTKNKGVGELAMLQYIKGKGILDKYDKIMYFGGRNLITSSHIFEAMYDMDIIIDVLISNKPYVYLNGDCEKESVGLYNTNVFVMRNEIMKKFADSIDYDYMLMGNLGVEQILYKFVYENKLNYENMGWLGIIRNDWQRNGKINDIGNYHIC